MLCLALCILMMAGCTLSPSSASSESSFPESSGEPGKLTPYRIGFCQFSESVSLNSVKEAFLGRMDEWGYGEERIQIDYQNAQGDEKEAQKICEKFVADKADLIVASSAPAAKAAVKATKGTQIKVVFAAVNDPASSLGIQNLKEPEGNVTGVASAFPADQLLELSLQIDPDLKKLGLLYSGEADSLGVVEQVKAFCKEKKIEVVEKAVPPGGDLSKEAKELCEATKALFTGADEGLDASVLQQVVWKAKIPWYTGASPLVREGAFASVSADYEEMGRFAADMAVELMAGKQVKEVPVRILDAAQVYLNQSVQKELGLSIPAQVAKKAVILENEEAA